MNRLLEVTDLTVSFTTDEGTFRAVEGVSFHVSPGEIVGLVGESGCGKSVTALSLLRLVPSPPGRIESGRILFKDEDLLRVGVKRMQEIRGNEISMIFQEPTSALSPLHRIGHQLVEAVQLHRAVSKKTAWDMAEAALKKVSLPDVSQKMFAYPHALSGGMQQRVMIAMALLLNPDLVIADEPTTALDVTVQAQIFEQLLQMREISTAVLLITHDMGIIWETCDRVLVMYAARVVEEAGKDALFKNPAHPYTRALLASIPRPVRNKSRLQVISGQVPSPLHFLSGCRFRDRCAFAHDRCAREVPELRNLGGGHRAACFLVKGV
ncbi:MAG: ABC transporter ATP-binding protein [Deltaproteobacteria bacterium]|nr:ABC transporter ATP-binding protein [Deltaproteobacteria bacterium]MBW2132721.1 ABC transporter ATP-binding protein [Deltaproteobacteria bacterium]